MSSLVNTKQKREMCRKCSDCVLTDGDDYDRISLYCLEGGMSVFMLAAGHHQRGVSCPESISP